MTFARLVVLVGVIEVLVVGSSSCPSNYCGNGVCVAGSDGNLTCYCSNGYTGQFCRTNFDDCARAACENNSTCIDGNDAYTCHCERGYRGKFCEVNFDDCHSSPCANNGTCVDGVNSFSCSCPSGFSGKSCEIDDLPCSRQCQNGGSCTKENGVQRCSCPVGYTGPGCDVQINGCQSEPCKNGGSCTAFVGHFHCRCPFGWAGDECDVKMSPCKENICENGGLCMTSGDVLTVCYCVPDYHGQRCELQYDDCSEDKCLNNGTCHDGVNDFTCECREGFGGSRCQHDCRVSLVSECVRMTTTAEPVTEEELTSKSDTATELNSTESSAENSTVLEPPKDLNVSQPVRQVLYSPRFDGNSSFLALPLSASSRSLDVEFKFMSSKDSGALLFAETEHSNLFLYLNNRTLHLQFKADEQQIILSTLITEPSDQFSAVKVSARTFERNSSELTVALMANARNALTSRLVSTDSQSLISFKELLFGRDLKDSRENFEGCLKDIRVQGERRFGADSGSSSANLSECTLDVCAQEPCSSRGSCEQTLEPHNSNFSCHCQPGFEGDFCQRVTCNDSGNGSSPCQNNGSCVMPGPGDQNYRCLCPNGWFGVDCQLKWNSSNSTSLAYNGLDSFASLTLSSSLKFNGLRFKFRTTNLSQERAVLLYMSNEAPWSRLRQDMAHSLVPTPDFLAVTLHKTHVVLQVNLGHGTTSLARPLDANATDHSVYVGHILQVAWLIVDSGDEALGRTPGTYSALNVSPLLWVGGRPRSPNDERLPSGVRPYNHFQGCIWEIERKLHKSTPWEPVNALGGITYMGGSRRTIKNERRVDSPSSKTTSALSRRRRGGGNENKDTSFALISKVTAQPPRSPRSPPPLILN